MAITFAGETQSNDIRRSVNDQEPIGMRTYTPTQLVIAKSAGLYHYTPEGRRLADFSSGVLVANLGHNPRRWLARFAQYMNWNASTLQDGPGYVELPPWTTYNAISPLEQQANDRLLRNMRACPGGQRMERILWAASGSEAIQKALWASLHFQPTKDIIIATRDGFHGKKGLAGAVTGNEQSPDRDPRVHFISFPKMECQDLALRGQPFDPAPYIKDLEQLHARFPNRLNCLVTEPYLGGGGSYHPPLAYLQAVQQFCRDHGIVFILDEVQANFGRTATMYAYEAYGLEPDIVVLGKGLANGYPVDAAVGRADVLGSLNYGEGSDTWSGHPLACAAVLATLDEFESTDVLSQARRLSGQIEQGLLRLKELPIVRAVRGEGVVFGVEFQDRGGLTANQVAVEAVKTCYLGDANGDAIHLLGPLAGKVVRISPPITTTAAEADHWLGVLHALLAQLAQRLSA